MRGRKPKPTLLKLVTGNPGKRPLNDREPKPKGDLAEPPDDLPENAKILWREAIESAPKGMLKVLDRRTLGVWAIAAALHQEATRRLSTTTLLVKTAGGQLMQNPYLPIVNRQAAIMPKAASELGFTPTSRTRLQIRDEDSADEWSEF